MNENSVCPIWGTLASVEPMSGRDGIFVDSPRAGGKYFISRRVQIILKNKEDELGQADSAEDGFMERPRKVDYPKARLTSWLIEQRQLGVKCPEITGYTIAEVDHRQHLPVPERADRLLQYLQKETSRIGERLSFYFGQRAVSSHNEIECIDDHLTSSQQNNWQMMAWSECAKKIDFDEVKFLLKYLQKRTWIEYEPSSDTCSLTVEGYARLAELEKVAIDSSQAFVAMWFEPSINNIYEKGIKPGIEDAGYKSLPIKEKEHINKIDDEIIAEIRRSRFVVADFTHGDTGARGSVYYEAGFAHGLNIPVIFTCREDILKDIHFDTRQYNHIPWEEDKLEEFRKALSDRISAVIGDGPKKEKDYEQDA